MDEKLGYGVIYYTKIFNRIIKSVYIGRLTPGIKKYKHVILTRLCEDGKENITAYRFNDFSINNLELSLTNFVQQKLTKREEEYADFLLKKKGL